MDEQKNVIFKFLQFLLKINTIFLLFLDTQFKLVDFYKYTRYINKSKIAFYVFFSIINVKVNYIYIYTYICLKHLENSIFFLHTYILFFIELYFE